MFPMEKYQDAAAFHLDQVHRYLANLVAVNVSRWSDVAVMSYIYVNQGTAH